MALISTLLSWMILLLPVTGQEDVSHLGSGPLKCIEGHSSCALPRDLCFRFAEYPSPTAPLLDILDENALEEEEPDEVGHPAICASGAFGALIVAASFSDDPTPREVRP